MSIKQLGINTWKLKEVNSPQVKKTLRFFFTKNYFVLDIINNE